MTSISDLNIVVQQSSRAQDMQQTGRQPHDAAQATAAQVDKEVDQKRTTVRQSDESDTIRPDKDRSGNRKHAKKRSVKKQKKAHAKTNGNITGTIIDTIV